MKINAPTSGALTHASSLYISLRVQKLTKSCVQPNVAGGACFFNEKRVSGVFLIYGEGVHGDVGRRHTPADSSRLPDRSLSGIDDTFRVSEAVVPNGGVGYG